LLSPIHRTSMGAGASLPTELSAETAKALAAMPDSAQKELQEVYSRVKPAAASLSVETTAQPVVADTATTPAATPAAATGKLDLMAQMAQFDLMTKQAQSTVESNSEKADEMNRKSVKQRRKSRDLEETVFGMHLTDVAQLRAIFDKIDTDKSDSIDVDELGEALAKTGKKKQDYQSGLHAVLTHYGKVHAGKNITFDEFRLMIKEWDEPGGAIEMIESGKP